MKKPDCCQNKKSNKDFEYVSDFLNAINEENRLKILCILREGERCACDIYEPLQIPQNLASHHLKVLKELNLIQSHKDGRKVIYSTNKKKINQYIKLLNNFLIKNI